MENIEGASLNLHQLAILAQDQGNYQVAGRLLKETLTLEEKMGNSLHTARSMAQLATLEWSVGNLPEAHRLMQDSLLLIKDLDAGDLRQAIEHDMKKIEDAIKHPSLAKRLMAWWKR